MRTSAQHRLDRFACAELAALPTGYLLLDELLRDAMRIRGYPRPLAAEIENSIRHLEDAGRIHGLRTETGIKWSLTDTGRAWHEQNS